jgi:hypothetical protein
VRYYVHVEDPGFPEEPWPGERRLGPYDDEDAAYEQAVDEAAYGGAVVLGVYEEDASEQSRDGARKRAVKTHAQIERRAETVRRYEARRRAEALSADRDALEAQHSMGLDELLTLREQG